MLRALAICPMHNAKGKRDVTGAFLPEARNFLQLHGANQSISLVRFDNRAPKRLRRAQVLEAIDQHKHGAPLEHIAFFCHGLRNAIQTGHASKTLGLHTTRTMLELVDVMRYRATHDCKVTLYCCDTARDNDREKADDNRPGTGGDGGFADVLRDLMSAAGFSGGWVDGHTVTAHTTRAPYVRRFYTDGDPNGGYGGDWIVAPRSPLWNRWRRALWGKRHPHRIRLRFPRLTIAEIHAALER